MLKANVALRVLFFCCSFLIGLSGFAQKKSGKIIEGMVSDKSGIPLPAATISIKNTRVHSLTNDQGKFHLATTLATGVIVVHYMGYQTIEMPFSEKSFLQPIKIVLSENGLTLKEVTTYGKITRGQAKALNAQKNGANIAHVVDAELFSRYPDISAAEVAQRLPGVSIVRDQGEGEFVQIRGIPEQYNSLTINGQRMPSVEPDAGRAVGLDLIQSTLIQKITVNKALTAEMDADAIGGMINFELKKATKATELELFAGYGFNQQQSEFKTYGKDIYTFNAQMGKRVLNNKLGILLTGNYFNTDKGSMFYAQAFQDRTKDTIHTRRATDYDVKRERYGFVGNFDYKSNSKHNWNLMLNYNRYKDLEVRRQANYTLSNTREERRTRNRLEDQEVMLAMFKGEHLFNQINWEYSMSYSDGKENLPDRVEFRYNRTNKAIKQMNRQQLNQLSVQTTFGDATPIKFSQASFSPRFTNEKNTTLATSLKIPFLDQQNSAWKTGLKYRMLRRKATDGSLRFTLPTGTKIPDIAEGGAAYEGIRFLSPEFSKIGFAETPASIDYDKILTGYTASEKVLAAYLLNETNWSPKLFSSIGVRLENTHTDYTNIKTPSEGNGQYTNIMPSAHFTYKINPANQLRIAYSSGLSRPDYAVLNPFEVIEIDQINRGNEKLKAITANNFDLMFEQYTGKLGFISIGVFGKLLANQIYTKQVDTKGGLPVFMPVNGEKAHLFGIEAATNQSLASLRIPLNINANYTFTSSNARYDSLHDDLPLANSPKHIANLSLIYEKPGSKLSAVLSGVYRHFVLNKFEDTDAASRGTEPIWLDKTFHLDFSAAYNFTKQLTMKFQLNNLTNQANIEVTGKPGDQYSQWSENESYGISGMLLLEWKL